MIMPAYKHSIIHLILYNFIMFMLEIIFIGNKTSQSHAYNSLCQNQSMHRIKRKQQNDIAL